MFFVVFYSVALYQDIVKIGSAEYIEVVFQKVVDEVLKVHCDIDESKRHDLILQLFVPSSKSCFLFHYQCHSEKVVGTCNIKPNKQLSALEPG